MSEDKRNQGSRSKSVVAPGKAGKPTRRDETTAGAGAAEEAAEPRPATASPAKTPPPPASTGHRGGGGKGLAFLALLLALLAGGGSAYVWYQMDLDRKQAAAADTRIEEALTNARQNADQLTQVKSSVDEVTSELAGKREALAAEVEKQKAALQGISTDLQARQDKLAKQMDNRVENLQVSQRGLTEELGTTGNQLKGYADETARKLSTRIDNLQLAQRGLNQSLETIREAVISGGDKNAWTLSEVGYLIQIADDRLRFQRDVDGALAAMTLAQQRLSGVDEMAFQPVLPILAEEIAILRGIKKEDLSAIANRIGDLASQVQELPLKNEMRTAAIKEKAAAERASKSADVDTSKEDWWDEAADKAWSEVKSLVVVRHERGSAPPLIAPDEEYFLAQNLRLKLEAARLALLMRNGALYQESLEIAREWIESYFEGSDDSVIASLNEIKELQQVELNPYLPDLSRAERAFNDVMSTRKPVRLVPLPGRTDEPAADKTSGASEASQGGDA